MFLVIIVKQNTHHQITKYLQIKNTINYDCILNATKNTHVHIATNTVLKEIILWAASGVCGVCMCVYVCCICACACVCMCVCVCVCMCVCVRACVHGSQGVPQEWYIQWTFSLAIR